MLPYSIIVLSIGTPVLHAAQRARGGRPRRRGARRHRRAASALSGCSSWSPRRPLSPPPRSPRPASSPTVRRRRRIAAGARAARAILVSLIPLAILFVVQRTFYAYDDTRTPFCFTLFQCVLVVAHRARRWAARRRRPVRHRSPRESPSASRSRASCRSIVATWLLQRKLGGLQIGSWMLAHRPLRPRRHPRRPSPAGASFLLARRRRGLDRRRTSSSGRSAPRSSASSSSSSTSAILALLARPRAQGRRHGAGPPVPARGR